MKDHYYLLEGKQKEYKKFVTDRKPLIFYSIYVGSQKTSFLQNFRRNK